MIRFSEIKPKYETKPTEKEDFVTYEVRADDEEDYDDVFGIKPLFYLA